MSDRIGIMRDGRLVQIGPPLEIYQQPRSRFVAEFMGEVNVLPVRRAGDGSYASGDLAGGFRVAGQRPDRGFIVVRPEFLKLLDDPSEAENVIEGVLYNSYSLGSRQQYRVRAGDTVLVAEQSRAAGPAPDLDARILVGWNSRDALFVEN